VHFHKLQNVLQESEILISPFVLLQYKLKSLLLHLKYTIIH